MSTLAKQFKSQEIMKENVLLESQVQWLLKPHLKSTSMGLFAQQLPFQPWADASLDIIHMAKDYHFEITDVSPGDGSMGEGLISKSQSSISGTHMVEAKNQNVFNSLNYFCL